MKAMKERLKKLWVICNVWRTWGYLLLLTHGNDYKNHVLNECRYWCKCLNMKGSMGKFMMWSWLLVYMKEYRNLSEYRLSTSGANKALTKIALVFLPRLSTLYLHVGKIGWNLYIQHGFSTVISAQSLGEYCWINQQVTVGYSYDDKPPVIGNGVRITAGAKVIGDIKLETMSSLVRMLW